MGNRWVHFLNSVALLKSIFLIQVKFYFASEFIVDNEVIVMIMLSAMLQRQGRD